METETETRQHRAIIRQKEAERRCGNISNTQRLRMEARGEFPQRLTISPIIVGYYEDEIEAWINSRLRGIGRPINVGRKRKPRPETTAEVQPQPLAASGK